MTESDTPNQRAVAGCSLPAAIGRLHVRRICASKAVFKVLVQSAGAACDEQRSAQSVKQSRKRERVQIGLGNLDKTR